MYDFESLYYSLTDGAVASFVITLVGAIVAVAAGFLLHCFVFGPKAKDPNASTLNKAANGQHFLPASIIKVAYYAGAVYLLFLGIAAFPASGWYGITTFISTAIFGNVILRVAYEIVMAARKAVGIDTDNNTAEEPKTETFINPALPKAAPQYPYQGPQYPGQMPQQYQQPYQQPPMQQYQQPQYQQPASAPMPVPTPVQPTPAQPVQAAPVQPVPTPVQPVQSAPIQQAQPVQSAPVAEVSLSKPIQTEAAQPVQQAQPSEMPCPSCGKLLKADAKFCPFCGKPMA